MPRESLPSTHRLQVFKKFLVFLNNKEYNTLVLVILHILPTDLGLDHIVRSVGGNRFGLYRPPRNRQIRWDFLRLWNMKLTNSKLTLKRRSECELNQHAYHFVNSWTRYFLFESIAFGTCICQLTFIADRGRYLSISIATLEACHDRLVSRQEGPG